MELNQLQKNYFINGYSNFNAKDEICKEKRLPNSEGHVISETMALNIMHKNK